MFKNKFNEDMSYEKRLLTEIDGALCLVIHYFLFLLDSWCAPMAYNLSSINIIIFKS